MQCSGSCGRLMVQKMMMMGGSIPSSESCRSSGSSPPRSASLTPSASSDPPRRGMAAVCPSSSQTRGPYSQQHLVHRASLPTSPPACPPPGPPYVPAHLPATWSTGWVSVCLLLWEALGSSAALPPPAQAAQVKKGHVDHRTSTSPPCWSGQVNKRHVNVAALLERSRLACAL